MPRSDHPPELVNAKNRTGWRRWLEKHHATSPRVWLVISKKKSEKTGVAYNDAVEEALCFGWIDSKMNVFDEERYILLFSPRKPRSIWSKSNKLRVQRLIQQGLMTKAGLEKIEAAKQDGSWSALDAIEQLSIPADLQQALERNLTAKKNFTRLNDSAKKMILYWIESAKRQETRAKRIRQAVALAAKDTKANPYRQQGERKNCCD
jgi:uncharacterized protein YdeI (YjbR/CyaY-like superfamily)